MFFTKEVKTPANTIITPCNHSFACVLCANHIKNNEKKCPICKNDVSDIIIININ